MINLIVIIGLGLLTVGLYFGLNKPASKDSREKYLKVLEKMLEGKCELMAGNDSNFKIDFVYDGNEYVYEDIEEKGFSDSTYKAFVRAKKQNGFVLEFIEKQKKRGITSDVFMVSDVVDSREEKAKDIELPGALGIFGVYTNDPSLLKKLIFDDKVVKIFSGFIYKDAVGYPYMPIKIDKEAIVLEFSSADSAIPSIHSIKNDLSAIEGYLDKLGYLVAQIEKVNHS